MDGEGISRVLAALIAKVPEWAASLLAVAVSAFAAVQGVRGIIGALKGLTGPTDQQVNAGIRQAVDDSLNGQLKKLSDKLDQLDEKVDQRHAENQLAIGELRGALGRIGGPRR